MTIAVLSWNSPLTLNQTLESYAEHGLSLLDDDRIIYFQEISDADIRLAQKWGWRWIGSTDNVGIAEGYKRLLEEATGEFFLFLENDWKLIEDPKKAIKESKWLLEEMPVDLIRLRHRKNPGNPLWTKQYEGRELDKPTHLLDSVHWMDPNSAYPTLVSKIYPLDQGHVWFMTEAKHANWTNNPHMAYTKFLRDNIAPRLTGDIERGLQEWWEKQYFIVAQGGGLFTHDRIDR